MPDDYYSYGYYSEDGYWGGNPDPFFFYHRRFFPFFPLFPFFPFFHHRRFW